MELAGIDLSAYSDKKLVVYETLYRNDRSAAEDPDAVNGKVRDADKVAEHKDFTDKDQTVYIPALKTKAYDIIDGESDILAEGKQTIIDKVSYTNVKPGVERTLIGTLMVKSTGLPLKDENGKEVTTEKTFTPAAESGEETLEFTIDAEALAGETLVVFERMYVGGIEVAAHIDLDDPDQTIYIPRITTTAKLSGGELDIDIDGTGDITVIDTVSYWNLIPGAEYTAKGYIVNASDGSPLKLANGKEVAAETIFTAPAPDGTIDVVYTFPREIVTGNIVVFESLVSATGKIIAKHEDPTDKGQTIPVPAIRTKAMDLRDKDKELLAKEGQTVVDIAYLTDLIPGEEYIVRGILMDKAGNTAIQGATGETRFTAKDAAMEIKVNIPLDGTSLAGKDVVVFEDLYRVVKKDPLTGDPLPAPIERRVATHRDLNDKEQTVTFITPPPKTGDDSALYEYMVLLVITLGLAISVYTRKRVGEK